MGIKNADHEETAPNAAVLIVSKLACSLAGTTQVVRIKRGSHAYCGAERCPKGIRLQCLVLPVA
jgi:hypothetical protein